MESESSVNDRAIRLFTFLREITSLRLKTIRDIESYEQVLWLSDLPHELGWSCAAWDMYSGEQKGDPNENEIWIEAKKPILPRCPQPPEGLRIWMKDEEIENPFCDVCPSIKDVIFETIMVPDDSGEMIEKVVERRLEDSPGLKQIWEKYVEKDWWTWAEEAKRQKPIQDVYAKLFSIYQKQQKLGEAFEIILGLGFLTWKTPSGYEIRRHLLTAQTEVSFGSAKGVISVAAAGDGAKFCLEQDMLELKDRPDLEEQYAASLGEIGDEIWDKVQLDTHLKGWVNSVSSEGKYEDCLQRQSSSQEFPTVHFAPALILRKRTERNYIRLFNEIIENLKSSETVPAGVRSLVDIVEKSFSAEGNDDFSGEANLGPSESGAVPDIYFPLAANDQQLEIVEKLASNQGVLVQGPPGTGKSQTIANLICHLLANGHRVLVTSQTARALESLREKIPEAIAPLCVSLLGNDQKALQSLEDSVLGITNRQHTWNASTNKATIDGLLKELDESRRCSAALSRKLREIREAETLAHKTRCGTYGGKLSHIARQLKEEEPTYEWIIPFYETEREAPLKNEEGLELLRLLHACAPSEFDALQSFCFMTDKLLRPPDLKELLKEEEALTEQADAAQSWKLNQNYQGLKSGDIAVRQNLDSNLSALRVKIAELGNHIQPWVKEATVEILGERDRKWRELLSETQRRLNLAKPLMAAISGMRVEGHSDVSFEHIKHAAEKLLKHIGTGGKLNFWLFKPRAIKDAYRTIRDIKVEDRKVDDAEKLENLAKWSAVKQQIQVLESMWKGLVSLKSERVQTIVAEYEDLCEPLEDGLSLYDKLGEVREAVASFSGVIPPVWHVSSEIDQFQTILRATLVDDSVASLSGKIATLRREICTQKDENPDLYAERFQSLLDALDQRSLANYTIAFDSLCKMVSEREKLSRCFSLLEQVRNVSTALVDELMSTCHEQDWQQRFGSIEQAWNWAAADDWLRRLADPEEGEKLAEDFERYRQRGNQLVGELAAAKAWGHCFADMTESERQHLIAWTQNMRKIGKGKGKYAAHHRAEARKNMQACRTAIPAWVMPIYRVVESVEPRTDAFDYVIVDEASQSGPEALFLQYLAKKIIIVGDNKQISPSHIGTHREEVEQVRKRYIQDIPHNANIGVDDSFFDLAMIRFPGFIRLREHFRCMPEIIQFSNNLFYKGEPLIPLKRYTSDRLPPVVPVFVEGGYAKGSEYKAYNPPEADAVVDKIVECCGDPLYADKTMGVISLRSTSTQAAEIERLLLERLGPSEYEKRQLICGDPYDLQGDERDVVFLTMVTAPKDDGTVRAVTDDRTGRAFNVATSRAKEQMFLFHSVTLNDLGPSCYRYRLLEYCLNPKIDRLEFEGESITWDRKVGPFDSLFEQRVFIKIAERGYKVIPQHEVAGFRIDLIVEGGGGRVLAVECDGDEWHGPERYDYDMARQRQLERSGWKFWRIRESTFYRDPDTAMEELWDTLERSKIFPDGAFEGVQKDVVVGEKATTVAVDCDGEPRIAEKRGAIIRTGKARQYELISDGLFGRGTVGPNYPELGGDGVASFGRFSDGRDGSELLEDYLEWNARSMADPRTANPDQIFEGLVEIIAQEGPMPCFRAYRLYANAAGIRRVGRQVEALFAKAISRGVRRKLIIIRQEHADKSRRLEIVRVPESTMVRLRKAGPRLMDEIPPSEIGCLMNYLLKSNDCDDPEALFREVICTYGIKRLASNIRALLEHALKAWAHNREGEAVSGEYLH